MTRGRSRRGGYEFERPRSTRSHTPTTPSLPRSPTGGEWGRVGPRDPWTRISPSSVGDLSFTERPEDAVLPSHAPNPPTHPRPDVRPTPSDTPLGTFRYIPVPRVSLYIHIYTVSVVHTPREGRGPRTTKPDRSQEKGGKDLRRPPYT